MGRGGFFEVRASVSSHTSLFIIMIYMIDIERGEGSISKSNSAVYLMLHPIQHLSCIPPVGPNGLLWVRGAGRV